MKNHISRTQRFDSQILDTCYVNDKHHKLDFINFYDSSSDFKEIPSIQDIWAKPKSKSAVESVTVLNKVFLMPKELKHISEEINYSKKILTLENGWDGFDAEAIPENIFLSSISLLVNYSKFILDTYNIAILAPEINPGRNSNIHLSWRSNRGRLIINIQDKGKGLLAYFYGDLKNDAHPNKGDVSVEKIGEHLAIWMKENLA